MAVRPWLVLKRQGNYSLFVRVGAGYFRGAKGDYLRSFENRNYGFTSTIWDDGEF